MKISCGHLPKSKLKFFFIAILRNRKGSKLILDKEPDFNLNKLIIGRKRLKYLQFVFQNPN